jgi:hypothetical protein
MTQVLLLAAALFIPGTPADTFDVQAELQGLYDEISQATLQFMTESDLDEFHEVLYTPDWVFIDTSGHEHAWADVRRGAVLALSAPRLDSMTQPIRTLSIDAKGALTVVNVVTVRTVVDREGRYGRAGASHTLTDTTAFRDRWIKVSDAWRLKSREQIGPPAESVDKRQ